MFTSLLLDEVKQQIERPLELLEPDRVGVEDGLEFVDVPWS